MLTPVACGAGTYCSTKVELAKSYRYRVPASSAAQYTPEGPNLVYQVLVTDVLTGKAKMLSPNKTIKMPPKIEDASLAG